MTSFVDTVVAGKKIKGKTKCTVKLVNSICGWMLIPITDNSLPALDRIYFAKYTELKPSQRTFAVGGSAKQALVAVRTAAGYEKISVSVCGDKKAPTLHMWYKE
jgi:hypothetical protein